jgi:hypothetical protein
LIGLTQPFADHAGIAVVRAFPPARFLQPGGNIRAILVAEIQRQRAVPAVPSAFRGRGARPRPTSWSTFRPSRSVSISTTLHGIGQKRRPPVSSFRYSRSFVEPDENALPRELAGAAGISEPRAVLLTADERLDCADVDALEAGQLRELENPRALHQFDHHFRVVEVAVELGEPTAAENLNERRFALALKALENDGKVELVAGFEDARHGAVIISRAMLSV